jgi:hypothetical protein
LPAAAAAVKTVVGSESGMCAPAAQIPGEQAEHVAQ